MSSVDGGRSVQGASEETFTNVCGPCNYGGYQKEATRYCNDCHDFLCRSCTDSHKGHKIFRNHKILHVRELINQAAATQPSRCTVLCNCSQNAGITDYCEDHDDVICQSCKTVKHRKCKTVSIQSKGSSYEKINLGTVAEKVVTLKDKIDKVLNERNDDLQELATKQANCRTDIKTFRNDLNRFLNSLEENMLKELEKLEAQERKEIERQLSTLSTAKQMLQADDSFLRDVKKSSEKSNMFAANVKVTKRLKDYENVLQDIRQEVKSPILTFERNEGLADMKSKITRFGSLTITNRQDHKSKNKIFPGMKVDSASLVDTKLPEDKTISKITGCAFMPDGQIVLCDYNNHRVKMLSSSFTMKEKLDLQTGPWDVSVINRGRVIITLPESMQLQYIEEAPSLKTGRVIQLDKECWGLEVSGAEIYVTCHSGYRGEGEVRCLDMNGNLKRRIGVNQDGSFMFRWPYYLTVSTSSGKIIVSDDFTATVTCLMSDGSVVYQYKDPDLGYPRGVCVDDEDNIIICGRSSNNAQVVTAAGKKLQKLLLSKYGIKEPYSVAYRPTDNTLIFGCFGQNKLFMYKVD